MTQSLEELEQAYSKGTNPLSFIPYADELRKRGELDKAMAVCSDGLQNSPNSIRGQTLAARIEYDKGHYDEAISRLKLVVQLAPGSFAPTLLLAKSYARERSFFEAKEQLDGLWMSHASNEEVQLLRRIVNAEISQTITSAGLNELTSSLGPADQVLQLRDQIEGLEGVHALFEFAITQEGGDIFFEDRVGEEIDEDVKVTLIECSRLTSKLNFGKPRQAIMECDEARFFIRLHEKRGALAISSHDVKLGRLRFLLDQYLKYRQEEVAK
jgi:tetratricopeptide (TPR) repeat protein